MNRLLVVMLCAGLFAPSIAEAVEITVVPAVALGKRADWKAAAKLEKRVLSALEKAGHTIKKAAKGAGKSALACKGDFACLAKVAGGGVSVSMVVWRVKRKRIPEVAVYAGSEQVAKLSGKMKRLKKLLKKVAAAIPAAPVKPEPVAAAEPAAVEEGAPTPAAVAAAAEVVSKPAPEPAPEPVPEPVPEPAPAAAPAVVTAPVAKSKGLSYGLLGTGAVLVGAGSYFGLQALSSRSAMAELPAGDDYDAEKEALSSNALLADVLIWPGLAVTGAGVYLMLQ
jgi:hypothetical protein